MEKREMYPESESGNQTTAFNGRLTTSTPDPEKCNSYFVNRLTPSQQHGQGFCTRNTGSSDFIEQPFSQEVEMKRESTRLMLQRRTELLQKSESENMNETQTDRRVAPQQQQTHTWQILNKGNQQSSGESRMNFDFTTHGKAPLPDSKGAKTHYTYRGSLSSHIDSAWNWLHSVRNVSLSPPSYSEDSQNMFHESQMDISKGKGLNKPDETDSAQSVMSNTPCTESLLTDVKEASIRPIDAKNPKKSEKRDISPAAQFNVNNNSDLHSSHMHKENVTQAIPEKKAVEQRGPIYPLSQEPQLLDKDAFESSFFDGDNHKDVKACSDTSDRHTALQHILQTQKELTGYLHLLSLMRKSGRKSVTEVCISREKIDEKLKKHFENMLHLISAPEIKPHLDKESQTEEYTPASHQEPQLRSRIKILSHQLNAREKETFMPAGASLQKEVLRLQLENGELQRQLLKVEGSLKEKEYHSAKQKMDFKQKITEMKQEHEFQRSRQLKHTKGMHNNMEQTSQRCQTLQKTTQDSERQIQDLQNQLHEKDSELHRLKELLGSRKDVLACHNPLEMSGNQRNRLPSTGLREFMPISYKASLQTGKADIAIAGRTVPSPIMNECNPVRFPSKDWTYASQQDSQQALNLPQISSTGTEDRPTILTDAVFPQTVDTTKQQQYSGNNNHFYHSWFGASTQNPWPSSMPYLNHSDPEGKRHAEVNLPQPYQSPFQERPTELFERMYLSSGAMHKQSSQHLFENRTNIVSSFGSQQTLSEFPLSDADDQSFYFSSIKTALHNVDDVNDYSKENTVENQIHMLSFAQEAPDYQEKRSNVGVIGDGRPVISSPSSSFLFNASNITQRDHFQGTVLDTSCSTIVDNDLSSIQNSTSAAISEKLAEGDAKFHERLRNLDAAILETQRGLCKVKSS